MHNPRPPRPNKVGTAKPVIVELGRVLKEPLRTKKVTQSLFPISSRKHNKEEAFFLVGRLVTVTRKWFGLSKKAETQFVYVICLGSSMVGYTRTKEAAKSIVRTLNKEMS